MQVGLIIASFFVALVLAALDVLGTYMEEYTWINMTIQLIELCAIGGIFIIYIMAYKNVSRLQRNNNKVLQTQNSNHINPANMRYVRSMIITIMLILMALIICYIPVLIIGLYTVIKAGVTGNSSPKRSFASYMSFQLGFTSSFLSAAIYLYRNKKCWNFIQQSLNRRTVSTQSIQLREIGATSHRFSVHPVVMRDTLNVVDQISSIESHVSKERI